jgi:hypothetical protein
MEKENTFGTPGGIKPQCAAYVFCRAMLSMKNLLKMGEFKYGDKTSDGYKFYKSNVMDQFYFMLEDIYKELKEDDIIEECGCGNSVHKRNGYQPCQWCNGCGYKNSNKFNQLLNRRKQVASAPVNNPPKTTAS